MLRTIRPERIFADPEVDAVVVEYVVQVCDENSGRVSTVLNLGLIRMLP